jgi:hypothetical protein
MIVEGIRIMRKNLYYCILLFSTLTSLYGCPVVRATGDAVQATGEGVGHAVEGTGDAVGRAGHELTH